MEKTKWKVNDQIIKYLNNFKITNTKSNIYKIKLKFQNRNKIKCLLKRIKY